VASHPHTGAVQHPPPEGHRVRFGRHMANHISCLSFLLLNLG
jgi:hypothetical protein